MACGWVFLVLIFVVAASEAVAVARYGAAEVLSFRSELARLSAISAIALLIDFWIALAAPHVGPQEGPRGFPSLAIVGALMLIAGGYLRFLAIMTLGPRFAARGEIPAAPADDPRLSFVGSGIYGYLRHPSEAGQILLAIGPALVLGSPLAALWAAAVIVPLTFVRLKREEAALCGYFSSYRAYREATPALLPRSARKCAG